MWVRIWFTKVHTIIRSKYCYVQAQLLWDFVPRLDFAHRQTNIVVVAWQREFVRFCWVWQVIFGLGIGCTGEYMYVFFFFFLGEHNSNALSGSRLFVRPTVRLSASRLHFQLFKHDALNASTFGSMISTNCCCHLCVVMQRSMYESVCKKPERISRRLQKKRKIKQ